MLSDLLFRLRSLFNRNTVEVELDEELRFHFEQQVEKLIATGHSRVEALRHARLTCGGLDQVKEECRDSRGVRQLETLVQDVRYGFRVLRKNPGFTAIAILTLALGIGANTALFSIVNGVLLNPLPYPHSEQLVSMHESKPNFAFGSISFPNFRDWQKNNRSFSAIAIGRSYSFGLSGLGEPEELNARFISSDFFRLIGVNPVLGRTFETGEDEVGAAPLAMISAGLWKRKFASSPEAIGRVLTLDGKDYAVIGVVPASFDLFLRTFRAADVYVGIGQWKNSALTNRGAGLGFHGIGRLKPGVTIEQAREDMKGVTHDLERIYVEDKGIGAGLIPIRDDILGDVRPVLLVLLVAVGCVLLIACVNVANLLLARAQGRAREFAVRSALGAGKTRLLRQLLTESTMLALAGGGLGLLLAYWGTQAALHALPVTLPRAAEVQLDSHVLIFTLSISLLAGIFFGLIPAFSASWIQVEHTLRESGRGSSGARHRTQNVFVVLEMALALVLLVGAGLMLRSLGALWSVDPGFHPEHVLTFNLSLPFSLTQAKPAEIRAAVREIDERLASTTGVQAASQTWGAFPFSGDDDEQFWPEGQPKPTNQYDMNWTLKYIVGPDYLRTMGIPLQRGRFITAQDDERAALVVVVDDVFARKFFAAENPIGKRLNLAGDERQVEIVGVVGHVNQWGFDRDASESLRAQMYIPCRQMPDSYMASVPGGGGTFIALHSDLPVADVLSAVRQNFLQMNSEEVIHSVETMHDIIADSLVARRSTAILLGSFAALAVLLSSIGTYGVVSYLVGERTRELGVRMALGAERSDVLNLILGQGAKLAGTGALLGLLASFALTRLMGSLLYGVSTTDPITFVGVAIILISVAMAACYVPARRASRLDPIESLRYE